MNRTLYKEARDHVKNVYELVCGWNDGYSEQREEFRGIVAPWMEKGRKYFLRFIGEIWLGSLKMPIDRPFKRGVPQGFGPSPLLACMALTPIYKKWGPKLIMYLDDGIIMSDEEINIEEFEEDLNSIGVGLSQSKSKIIKKDGIWKSENLKFLGLNYNCRTENLSGMTRNGSTVMWPKLDAMRDWNIWSSSDYKTVWLKSIEEETNFLKLKKTDLWGLALSLMYSSPSKAVERLKLPQHEDSLLTRSEMENFSMSKVAQSSLLTPILMNAIEQSKVRTRFIQKELYD